MSYFASSAQDIAVSQSRFHGGHGCESAGAAPSVFDRRSINLTRIENKNRSKNRTPIIFQPEKVGVLFCLLALLPSAGIRLF